MKLITQHFLLDSSIGILEPLPFSMKFTDFFLENINNYKDICVFGYININSVNKKNNHYLNQVDGLDPTPYFSFQARGSILDVT